MQLHRGMAMTQRLLSHSKCFLFVALLLVSHQANAWFFFFPGSLIQKATETDPESIVVNSSDRSVAKCAGAHLNQARKFSAVSGSQYEDRSGGSPATPTQSAQTVFHEKMVDFAIEKAIEKDKAKELASAYSVRWGRVAGSDQAMGRTYAQDLVQGCRQNGVPITVAEYDKLQAQQEEKKRKQFEDARRETDQAQQRAFAEQEAAKQAEVRRKETERNDASLQPTVAAKELTVEDRLKDLKRLSDAGLISQDVYLERQRLILDGRR